VSRRVYPSIAPAGTRKPACFAPAVWPAGPIGFVSHSPPSKCFLAGCLPYYPRFCPKNPDSHVPRAKYTSWLSPKTAFFGAPAQTATLSDRQGWRSEFFAQKRHLRRTTGNCLAERGVSVTSVLRGSEPSFRSGAEGMPPQTPSHGQVDPRHGQFRQPDLRPAGRHGLQRSFRVRVLSPPVPVQPRRDNLTKAEGAPLGLRPIRR
jgi:hypothetical protein